VPAHFDIGGANYAVGNNDFADTVDLSGFAELAKLSTVSVPIVAACIFQTGHHYITGGDSNATYQTMIAGHERQYLDRLNPKLETQFGVSHNDLYDLVLHKAPHPINDATFALAGSNEDVKEVLAGMGFSSVALRLPLLSDKEKAINNIATISSHVNSLSGSLNVVIDPVLCDRALMIAAACANHPRNPTVLAFRTMSASQKDALLDPYINMVMPHAAKAYGLFMGYAEVNGTRLAGTLTASYTYKTARDDHSGQYTEAHAHGQAAARYRKKEMETGGLKGLKIGEGGANAPAHLDPVIDPAKTEQRDMMHAMMAAMGGRAAP
jgi:hypothetical protein